MIGETVMGDTVVGDAVIGGCRNRHRSWSNHGKNYRWCSHQWCIDAWQDVDIFHFVFVSFCSDYFCMDMASWDVDTWRTFNVGVTGTRSSIQFVRSRADRALKANVLGRKGPSRWSRLSGGRWSRIRLSGNRLSGGQLSRNGLTSSGLTGSSLTSSKLDKSLHQADDSVPFFVSCSD